MPHRISWLRLAGVAALVVAFTPARTSAQTFTTRLSGANESPANASPGIGFATIVLNGDQLSINMTFSGLLGTTTASHIHCCTGTPFTGTAMVATQTPTFAGFPLGVTSGSYPTTIFDLTLASSYNPAFITANGGTTASAEAVLKAGLLNGTSYLNIHTTVVPGGEIRGFIVATPEPASLVLLGTGLLAMGGVARRRRRTVA